MDSPLAALAPVVSPAAGLSERDQQIIGFERQWWKYAGAKEQAIRELFGMSATRYYQVLNALIDSPAALAYDPCSSSVCGGCARPVSEPVPRGGSGSTPDPVSRTLACRA